MLSIHVFPPLVIGSLLAILAICVLIRNRASLESMIFGLMVLSAMIWQLSYAGLFSAANEVTAWHWVRLEHAGVVFIPSFLYLFASMMVRRTYICRYYLIGSFVLSCIFLATVYAGRLFISNLEQYNWGYYARYGPLGALFVIVFFVTMVANLKLYWRGFRQSVTPRRKKLFFSLFLAFAVAQLGAVDFFAVFGIPIYPLGSIPMLIFVIILLPTMWQVRLSEITASLVADSLLDAVSDILFVIDRKGKIQIVNRAGCEFFGKDSFALVGQSIKEYFGPDFTVETQQRLILKDHIKRAHFFRIETRPIEHKQHGNLGTIVVATDETAQMRANETIRNQEEQFQQTIQCIVDCAVLRLGPNGLIETCSQGAGILFGFQEAKLIDQHFSVLFPDKENAKIPPTEILLEAMQHGRYEYRDRCVRFDRSEFLAQVSVNTIRSESNSILGFAVIVRDLASKKKMYLT